MSKLEITDLEIKYRTDDGVNHAVNGVSLQLEKNETLGLVGESGSGKTTVAEAILGILPKNAKITNGSIVYDGTDLTELSEKEFREFRWNHISMIPQSSMNALDPVYRVGDQIVEIIRAHEDVSKRDARDRAATLFETVGIATDRLEDYPHQLSGGMKQRAMIALSLALDPEIVLADEPTTALDVIIQKRILDRIKEIQRERDMAMLLITHDVSVVAETCDKIAVFYAGNLVEYADADSIINDPSHPYTLGLRNAFPSLSAESDLISIPGVPPDMSEYNEQCQFANRCPFAIEECYERDPAIERVGDGHYASCHRSDEADKLRKRAARPETWKQIGVNNDD